MDCVHGCLYTGYPSRQTIDGCVCNGLMITESGKLMGTKWSFQMNYASIIETMMVAYLIHVQQLQEIKLLMRIQATRNSLPHAVIQNLFDSMPRRIAALIAALGGYPKY
ncbi:transposable element Tcb2 transposase [Trichonephila clavipes]|uniref:Transposable element Tcb2 transposase n=1 Tax=Trichonephila clavipes TaxID=2585209 RepID=A0A8X6T118_TRICX|nr:transposable element Tcb2 transposase [Trichonephila clavipes]